MATGIVCEGDRDSPTVLVLDPAPRIDHGELPGGWNELTEHRRVVWCRLAATEALPKVERLLADPDALGRPIDVVTHADPGERVRALLNRNAGPVRALLLVDPAPNGRAGGGIDSIGGLTVRTVGRARRVPRPLRRHDVCAQVRAAIEALDAGSSVPARSPARQKAQGGT